MIIFHEGLPGHGKSYAALVDHIVPALKKGRKVFAYIEGLNYEKIAEVTELSVDRLKELLFQIERAQVNEIYKHVENNSLVVIDELQNFWPSGRQKLDEATTKFVTEHRHRGLDILCMGQVLNDCHALWKGRVDMKVMFLKKDAVGKPNEYRYFVFKPVIERGKTVFKETTKGASEYDSKYFGCYASHESETENKGTYTDDRANVKNSKAWKTIKIYGVIAVVSLGFIIWFFSGGGAKAFGAKPPVAQVDPNAVAAAENAKVTAGQQAKPAAPAQEKKEVPQMWSGAPNDYIDELAKNARPRLGGTLKIGNRVAAYIEWRDQSNRLIERLTIHELQGLGWYVMVSADGGIATISKPGKTYVATQWPMQDDRSTAPERVPDEQQKAIQGQQPARLAHSVL